ncbi:peptidylprolyl isomerase [Arthrobacter sp. H5]|uniref:peptidylprolyl isomerase n=1 Tax=Arthrobacter sp. H5 TaxID=1267973 RepID=UPI0004B708D8|nr:peptidylprolyl isomerase [Arthrobacter sp. H5]
MEAKRTIREHQVSRRKRDSLIAGLAAVVVLAVAISLQIFWFSSDPSAAEVDALDDAPGVQETPPASPAAIPDPSTADGQVFTGTLATSEGEVGVALDGNLAPQAVAVFKSLADEGFFQGKTCHRLTTAETMGVLQCGSLNGDGAGDPNYQWGPVENTPEDGVYPAGSIAVARGESIDSNGTQFFIVYKDSQITQETGGYTIMGKVTSGLDVVQGIADGGVEGGAQDGPPAVPVTIDSLTLQ